MKTTVFAAAIILFILLVPFASSPDGPEQGETAQPCSTMNKIYHYAAAEGLWANSHIKG